MVGLADGSVETFRGRGSGRSGETQDRIRFVTLNEVNASRIPGFFAGSAFARDDCLDAADDHFIIES
jgi:hypothetical protein